MGMPGFQCSAFQQSAFQNDCADGGGGGGGGEGGAELRGFIVNIMDGGESPAMAGKFTEITAAYHADFVLPLTDSMYVVNYSGGNSIIKRFADETVPRKAATYITRDVILPRPENFGVLQLVARCDAPSGVRFVTCIVTADGGFDPTGNPEASRVFVHTFTLFGGDNLQQITRLPSGFKARRWSVAIGVYPDVEIYEVNLAGTALELMTV